MTKETKKKEEPMRPDPLADLGLTGSATDLVKDVKETVTGKMQETPAEEKPVPAEPVPAADLKLRFEELFTKNKDDKDNGTTVWLSKANKKKLDTLKFKSEGKYQLRPTVNAIIELFFENYKK